MIPILYPAGEQDFNTGGLGALTDCITCEVTETAGTWEFECKFTYPTNARMFPSIKIGTIIYVDHDNTKSPQPFDIYAYDVDVNGIATFYAHHISYRLSNLIIIPGTLHDRPFNILESIIEGSNLEYRSGVYGPVYYHFNRSRYGKEWATGNSTVTLNKKGFQSYSHVSNANDIEWDYLVDKPKSVRDALIGSEGTISFLYNAEYKFDMWDVHVYVGQTRGVDRPTAIRYSHNMTGLTYEYDTSGTVKALIPFWVDRETNAPFYLDGDKDFEYQYDSATVATDTSQMGDAFDAVALDLSDQFDQQPTALQLIEAAIEYANLNSLSAPRENLTIDFKQLKDSPEFADLMDKRDLLLCDTCTVIFPEMRLFKRMKVSQTVYDPLAGGFAGRYTQVQLGTVSPGIFTIDSVLNTPQTSPDEFVVDSGVEIPDTDDLPDDYENPVEIDPNEPEWNGPDEDAIIEYEDP